MLAPRASILRVLNAAGETEGTAFFAVPRGLVVTCTHVLERPGVLVNGRARLEFSDALDGQTYPLTGICCPEWSSPSRARDLSILRLEEALPSGAVPLSLGIAQPVVGEQISSYGFPQANRRHGMPGLGTVVGLARDPWAGWPVLVVVSDTISQGFSGAPASR